MTLSDQKLSRRHLGLAAAGAALAPLVAGAPALANGDEAAIKANIETFRTAMIAKDTKKLAELVSDDLSYGHSAGVIENKAQFLKAVDERKATVKKLEYPDIKIQVNGSSAIARHIWESENELNGKTTQTRIGVIQVWQKGADGKWKIYARQAHIFPPKA